MYKWNKVLIATAACLLLPMSVVAQLDCEALANSALAEPEGYAEQCLGEVDYQPGFFPEAPTDIGYAHDIGFISDNFNSFVLNDFPGQTATGTNALPIFGYDFDETATTLYAIDTTANTLGTSDLAGGFTPIGPITGFASNISGMTIAADGTMYMSTTNCGVESSLYTVDLGTQVATLVGTTLTATCVIDIAINCEGVMYAHDIVSDSIYTMDTTTGAATLVGPTGLAANFAQGMDFDFDDGTLYIFLYTGGGANTFGTVDLGTGAVTALATDNPLGEFEGAVQTACFVAPPTPVMEIPTLNLWGIGALVLLLLGLSVGILRRRTA